MASPQPGYAWQAAAFMLMRRIAIQGVPKWRLIIVRLAKHFGLSFETAKKKFTKVDAEAKYAMRRKADTHFGKICQFFDTTKRCCTIYNARPTICRDYPGGGCGYYGFLMAERNSQEDKTHVASTWNG